MKDGMQAETIAVLANNLALPMGLVVDEVVVESGKASVQFQPFALDLDAPAQVRAKIGAASVAAFLEQQAPGGLRAFAVTIKDGIVTVEATAKVIVEIRVSAECQLRIADHTQLWADLKSVSVKAPMAHSMVEQQLAKVNPLLDLGELAKNLSLDSVTAHDGFLTVTGHANWP